VHKGGQAMYSKALLGAAALKAAAAEEEVGLTVDGYFELTN